MAYTTYTEIQADFKDMTFTSSTNVTSSDVTQFIVESDSLINAYVGTVYSVPVTVSGDGLSLLKLLSRSLVSSRIKKLLEVKQEKSTDANQSVMGVLLSVAQVIKILNDIQDKNMALAGAVPLISGGGFYNNNVANDISPVIKKDERQW